MGRFWSGLVGVAVVAAGFGSRPLAAQQPGDELQSLSRARDEYLRSTYGELKIVLEEWKDLHARRDVPKLTKLFDEAGLYSPVDGWIAQGRAEIMDSLKVRLPRMQSYSTTLVDFTAGGSLAYYMGRMQYQLDSGAAAGTTVIGTFVLVLHLDGHHWKVRSYVERGT
ncbi:MAG: nuclear transport factor 2 family protein [Gemmatimonadota bacterium]